MLLLAGASCDGGSWEVYVRAWYRRSMQSDLWWIVEMLTSMLYFSLLFSFLCAFYHVV